MGRLLSLLQIQSGGKLAMSTSSQLEKIRLSQWDALSLESLLSFGWTEEQLLNHIHEGTLPIDTSPFKFDYVSLSTWIRANEAEFKRVLKEGYQIKYNTIRGISSWIKLALNVEAELVLEPGQEAVIARLTPQEAARLASVLSLGWTIIPDSEASNPIDQQAESDARSLFRIILSSSKNTPAAGA